MLIFTCTDLRANIKSGKYKFLLNQQTLNNADNQKIKDRAPSDYKSDILGNIQEIMESAICPDNALDLHYNMFIHKRAEMLLSYAKSLI